MLPNIKMMKNNMENKNISNTLKQLLKGLFPGAKVGNIDLLNCKRQELGIDIKQFNQMMKKFIRYKWIVKLNSKEPPTCEDYGNYALELLTNDNIILEPKEEQKIISFKLDFALRMDNASCKLA